MGNDKNSLFEAFGKIVLKSCIIENEVANRTIIDSESFQFVTLEAVKLSDAQYLVKDLEKLVEKLDDAVAKIYRYGYETEIYEKLVQELKVKHGRLRYLTSYFVDTREKIEAARLKLDEMELKLIKKEERKKIIERQILELEEKRKKNLRMLKKKDRKRGRPAKKSELERDVILHLSPVRSSGTHSNRAPSTIAEMSDDFYSID